MGAEDGEFFGAGGPAWLPDDDCGRVHSVRQPELHLCMPHLGCYVPGVGSESRWQRLLGHGQYWRLPELQSGVVLRLRSSVRASLVSRSRKNPYRSLAVAALLRGRARERAVKLLQRRHTNPSATGAIRLAAAGFSFTTYRRAPQHSP